VAAEAHFYKSLGHMPAYSKLKFTVTKVESVNNKMLREQFGRSMSFFYTQGYPSVVESVYHGTHPKNIDSILRDNLKLDPSQQIDNGWFGRGMYFSQHADYTMMYRTTGDLRRVRAGDNIMLLRFDILPGRTHTLKDVKVGIPRMQLKDSHISPFSFEHVMFDPRHVTPTHVIHVAVTNAPGNSFDGSPEQTGPVGAAGAGAAAGGAAGAVGPVAGAAGAAAGAVGPIAAAGAAAGAAAAVGGAYMTDDEESDKEDDDVDE
jgi:hypothetical protein